MTGGGVPAHDSWDRSIELSLNLFLHRPVVPPGQQAGDDDESGRPQTHNAFDQPVQSPQRLRCIMSLTVIVGSNQQENDIRVTHRAEPSRNTRGNLVDPVPGM